MNKNESKYFNTALLMDEALLLILERKDFEFITIKEICQKAGVNRSTFYLHYQNMNDLLEETIDLLNKRFASSFPKEITISQAINEDKILTQRKYLLPYLNFVKENKRAYKLTISNPSLFKSDVTFTRLYKSIFLPVLISSGTKEEERDYIFNFYMNGVVSIINKWLEKDCEDDVELIIDIIERLTFAK